MTYTSPTSSGPSTAAQTPSRRLLTRPAPALFPCRGTLAIHRLVRSPRTHVARRVSAWATSACPDLSPAARLESLIPQRMYFIAQATAFLDDETSVTRYAVSPTQIGQVPPCPAVARSRTAAWAILDNN